jgi:hypothetical protein
LKGFANPSIGVKNGLTRRVEGIADREPFEQLAAACFGLLACLESLPKNFQFHHAKSTFDTQDQLVIE